MFGVCWLQFKMWAVEISGMFKCTGQAHRYWANLSRNCSVFTYDRIRIVTCILYEDFCSYDLNHYVSILSSVLVVSFNPGMASAWCYRLFLLFSVFSGVVGQVLLVFLVYRIRLRLASGFSYVQRCCQWCWKSWRDWQSWRPSNNSWIS